MMYDDYDDEPSVLLPLLIAIAVHGLAVMAFIYGYQEKPKPKVVVLQASVMSAKESARLQKSAEQSAKQSTSTNNSTAKDTKKSTNNTAEVGGDDTPKPSKISEYNARLAERERAYAKELAEYTASLDRQIAHDIEQRRQMLKEMDEARQREVDALKSRAKSRDEHAVANTNKTKTPNPTDRTAQDQPKETSSNPVETQLHSLNNDSPPIPNVGRDGQVGSTSNVSKSEAQNNIAGRVQAIWERYKNPKNRHLIATIRIDEQGNLVSVSFGAGDKDLQPSLEASIREASPFPEMKGISRSFSIQFYTD